MSASKFCPTPIAPSSKLSSTNGNAFSDATLYISTIKALQYLTLTRPDIAFAVNKLSQFLSCPSQVHLLAVKRVLKYIKGIPYIGLVF